MFKMWSAFHFLFILSPFIFTVIFQTDCFSKTRSGKKADCGTRFIGSCGCDIIASKRGNFREIRL